jgi:hypothetical protein
MSACGHASGRKRESAPRAQGVIERGLALGDVLFYYAERYGAKASSSGGGAPREVSKVNAIFREAERISA